eukprot:COSAG05_NODE_1510_length_4685_cov_3.769298_3_plen_174_part_00
MTRIAALFVPACVGQCDLILRLSFPVCVCVCVCVRVRGVLVRGAQVAWDQSLWHSYRGSVRSCQRINFFRTKDKDVPLNTPGNFGTTQHQDLGIVTVGVKGLGGGLAMHPRGSEFVYDMSDWRSVEQFMDERTGEPRSTTTPTNLTTEPLNHARPCAHTGIEAQPRSTRSTCA